MRFPKSARLRHRSDYARLRKEGRQLNFTTIRFRVAPSPTGHARLGTAVPRRVGPAVVRNRIKRWLREAFRQRMDRLAPFDIVASPQFANPPSSLAEVEADLIALDERLAAETGAA